MAIYQRSTPVGLDKAITRFQSYINNKLTFANWDSFDRVYLNEKNTTGLVPEYYTGDGEYKEVLYNDTMDISSFFFRSSKEVRTDTGYECDVALIVQCDLIALFGSRDDEQLNRLFKLVSFNYSLKDDFLLSDIEHQINNVYREFDKKQIKFDDISNRHAVRFNYRVRYDVSCS